MNASGRLAAMLVTLVCASCAVSAPPSAPSKAATSTSTAEPVARIVATKRIDARTVDLTVASPAVGSSVPVRLLLPTRYASRPRHRWPVLYLLHGCCDSYLSWTRSTDVERLTRDLELLVAMHDGGPVGFYSDWRSGPAWETFHTDELPQLLTEFYRAAEPAAIAGVSMGGLGALDYAARHPDRYAAAASFSGIAHTELSHGTSQGYLSLLSAHGVSDPLALWGDPQTDSPTWREHNPYDLAPQLTRIPLFISSGNGLPGPLDQPGAPPDQIEPEIFAENTTLVRHLRQLRAADLTVDFYGNGTHNWLYWQRELHRAWPVLTKGLHLDP